MTEQELTERIYAQRMQEEKADKIRRFRRLNPYVKKGQIVFAGSSLMEQFPIYEFLQDFDLPFTVYNRGVGGFTTAEMLPVLQECVYDLAPAYLFLNIGTNDLNVREYSLDALIGWLDRILQDIRGHLPGAEIFLLAYYPVHPGVTDIPYLTELFRCRTNERIRAANEGVRALAARRGVRFLDLNGYLTDENGNLKAEYTIEGMHMYANGYKAVLDALLPVLNELK